MRRKRSASCASSTLSCRRPVERDTGAGEDHETTKGHVELARLFDSITREWLERPLAVSRVVARNHERGRVRERHGERERAPLPERHTAGYHERP